MLFEIQEINLNIFIRYKIESGKQKVFWANKKYFGYFMLKQ